MTPLTWILIATAAALAGFFAGRASRGSATSNATSATGNAGHDAVLKPGAADEGARMRGGSL